MPAATLLNRIRFVEAIEQDYDVHFNGKDFVICYLHVNHMKHYNRLFGIEAGDKALHDIIDWLAGISTGGLVARYAGDGLAFMVERYRVDAIPLAVNSFLPTYGEVNGLEAKIGAVVCTLPWSVDDCLRRALYACNTIVNQDGSNVCWFTGKVQNEFNRFAYIIDHLDDAIANGEIRAWSQPIVRVLTGKVCEVEVLARWKSEQYGFLFPNEFIPILEQYQLIHKLDLEVIRLACSQWANANAAGISVPFGINLSRLDFELCDIYTAIRGYMARYNVPVDQLHIEVTESSSIKDHNVLMEGVHRFREAGFEVYMDDFGSGYSSLGQMANLHFDVIKIDKSLIDNVEHDERARAVLADTVTLVKRLGMQTLCEGVETQKQLEFLRVVGCEKAQGYLFDRPAAYEHIMELLAAQMSDHEPVVENSYLDAVGQVNLIDCTSANIHGIEASAFLGRSPAAVLELADGRWRQLTCNFAFQRLITNMGFSHFDEMASMPTQTADRVNARAKHTALASRTSGETETFDFIMNGIFCSATMLFVAESNGHQAYLNTVTSVQNAPQVTEHTLLEGVLETSNLCFFWKDVNRRFLGANQRFYDYYGFKGLGDILGKTDEDMGWHINNDIFHSDEERVLQGEAIVDVPGVCMCHGEYRDIIATKRPLVSNGAIVGLVGFFEDVGPHKA